jgi:non-ribosomal peptide synthase protein (TIGR01720 family)
LVLDVEGHGRASPWPDVDLSRTTGWFTTIYPVAIKADPADPPERSLREAGRALSDVPGGGLGYGVLRYIRGAERLRAVDSPDVRFNYLGNVVDDGSVGELFGPAEESTGPLADPTGQRAYLLDVTAIVSADRLRMTWIYSPEALPRDTARCLAEQTLDELRFVLSANRANLAPEAFELVGLDQAQLDSIVAALARADGSS